MESVAYIFLLLLRLIGGDDPNSQTVNFDVINQPSIFLEWKQPDGRKTLV